MKLSTPLYYIDQQKQDPTPIGDLLQLTEWLYNGLDICGTPGHPDSEQCPFFYSMAELQVWLNKQNESSNVATVVEVTTWGQLQEYLRLQARCGAWPGYVAERAFL